MIVQPSLQNSMRARDAVRARTFAAHLRLPGWAGTVDAYPAGTSAVPLAHTTARCARKHRHRTPLARLHLAGSVRLHACASPAA